MDPQAFDRLVDQVDELRTEDLPGFRLEVAKGFGKIDARFARLETRMETKAKVAGAIAGGFTGAVGTAWVIVQMVRMATS